MRKIVSLAAVAAASAALFLPAAPAHAVHCDVVFAVGGAYGDLDAKLGDRLPDIVWFCLDH